MLFVCVLSISVAQVTYIVIAVHTDFPGWCCCVRYAGGMSEKIIGKYMEERKNLDKVMTIMF